MLATDVILWVKKHASLAQLCENGGWPDPSRISVDVLSKDNSTWILDVEFTETITEMSECDVRESKRGGMFVISFDTRGYPKDIRMTERLWNEGDPLV